MTTSQKAPGIAAEKARLIDEKKSQPLSPPTYDSLQLAPPLDRLLLAPCPGTSSLPCSPALVPQGDSGWLRNVDRYD